jgi:transcriptional regulator NrdR family protein
MKCPACGAWVEVLQTKKKDDNTKYRRYVCGNEHRFTTLETFVKIIKPRNAKQAEQNRKNAP